MVKIIATFFAPLDVYEPAGMFTGSHVIATLSCLFILAMLFKYSRDLAWPSILMLTRRLALVITCLELIKISYNFSYGYTWLDAWLPLSFCSLFIYALWLSGYAKGRLKQVGDSFILIGCFVGGIGFLIFPTTSLMRYPVWHYLSLYSLIFHTIMIYLSLMYMKHKQVTVNKQTILAFTGYFLIFAVISVLINTATGANIMLLREPYNVPFRFIHELRAANQGLYTLVAMSCYLIAPIIVSASISTLMTKKEIDVQKIRFD